MLPRNIAHYCVKCLAPNALGQELCQRCGTRLMLVVEPRGARFDEATVSGIGEEHLLERVSALENKLARLTEKVAQALELLLRQARNSQLDHLAVQALVSALTDAELLAKGRLRARTGEQDRARKSWPRSSERLALLEAEISSQSAVPGIRKLRARLIEGWEFAEAGEYRNAIRVLLKISSKSFDSPELNALIGEMFFRLGEMDIARRYLLNAVIVCERRPAFALLLGIASGDCGFPVESRTWLLKARKLGCRASSLSFCLGMLALAEADAPSADVEFRRCSRGGETLSSYGFAKLYFQQGRFALCLRRLGKLLIAEPDNGDLIELRLLAIRAQRGALQEGEGTIPAGKGRLASPRKVTRFLKKGPGDDPSSGREGMISGGSKWARGLVLENALSFLSTQGM